MRVGGTRLFVLLAFGLRPAALHLDLDFTARFRDALLMRRVRQGLLGRLIFLPRDRLILRLRGRLRCLPFRFRRRQTARGRTRRLGLSLDGGAVGGVVNGPSTRVEGESGKQSDGQDGQRGVEQREPRSGTTK